VIGALLLVCVLHSANDALLTLHDIPVAAHLAYVLVAAVSHGLFHRLTRDLDLPRERAS